MNDEPMTCDQARDLAAGYVLGALERSEEAAVRDHLATCDQPHSEFGALGGVVPALIEAELAGLDLVEPPAGLRDRILRAAAADLAANPRTARPAPARERAPARPTPAGGGSPVVPSVAPIPFPSDAERTARGERARTGRFDWALRIAAVLAIVASGAWTLSQQGQLDRARAFDEAVSAVVDAAGQPGAKTVVLSTQKGQQGSGVGAVAADGSVVLALHDLPATSGGQVYAAWVIVGDVPVNVGDFAVDASGTRAFKTRSATTPAGAIIAVTLEPNAGNTAPEGPVVSAGQAAAPPGATG